MTHLKPDDSLHDHWLNVAKQIKLGAQITIFQDGNSPQEWGQLEFIRLEIMSYEPFTATLTTIQAKIIINATYPWKLKTIHSQDGVNYGK